MIILDSAGSLIMSFIIPNVSIFVVNNYFLSPAQLLSAIRPFVSPQTSAHQAFIYQHMTNVSHTLENVYEKFCNLLHILI